MSRDSACRTSPTISRSGRMRSASLTSLRMSISPVPSRFCCLVCNPTTSRRLTFSSKISSMVITRSRLPIEEDRQLSIVVLPACVAPETSTFSPAATATSR